MSRLILIKKPILQKIKGIVIKDVGVNLVIRKKNLIFDTKHKTYLERGRKVTIRKKEGSLAKVGDLITAISCRKLSPIVYYREL